jgi:CBS-domain-containing membrane protein
VNYQQSSLETRSCYIWRVEKQPQHGSWALKAGDCVSGTPTGEDANLTVRDLMRRRPKTLPREATVGDLRRLFANPLVLNALVVDGAAFVGVVDRDDVDDRRDDARAEALARSAGVTISPEATSTEAMDRLDKDGSWRLVVVAPDGVTLEGLLCLNSKRSGFCQ